MIRVDEVLDIGYYGLLGTLGINNNDAVTIKEYKYSEAGCLITVCYF